MPKQRENKKRKKSNNSDHDHNNSVHDISSGDLEVIVSTVIGEVNKTLYGTCDVTESGADISDGNGEQGVSHTEQTDKVTEPTQKAKTNKSHINELVNVHTRLAVLQKESETTNKKLDNICNKLGKLDTIETKLMHMDNTIKNLQTRVSKVENKNNDVEQSVAFMSERYDKMNSEAVRITNATEAIKTQMQEQKNQMLQFEKQISDLNDKKQKTIKDVENTRKEIDRHAKMIENIACGMDNVRRDKRETDERILDLQYRSMKMNLIFDNLEGENRDENIYHKLRCFLANELDIHKDIQFGNVHRYGRFVRGRPRPVIARFLYQEDLDMVLDRAPALRGTQFRIYRQYPAVMSDRRRDLKPVMDQFWRDGARVKLVRDRLYVNGELYDPSDDQWDGDDADDIVPMDHNQYQSESGDHSG